MKLQRKVKYRSFDLLSVVESAIKLRVKVFDHIVAFTFQKALPIVTKLGKL
jgi:hypothetical protein